MCTAKCYRRILKILIAEEYNVSKSFLYRKINCLQVYTIKCKQKRKSQQLLIASLTFYVIIKI